MCGKTLTDPAAVKIGRCTEHPSDVDVELLDALRAWRSNEAKQRSVPAYVVFTDATLVALAEQRPTDTKGLVTIPGIGASKLERYGERRADDGARARRARKKFSELRGNSVAARARGPLGSIAPAQDVPGRVAATGGVPVMKLLFTGTPVSPAR